MRVLTGRHEGVFGRVRLENTKLRRDPVPEVSIGGVVTQSTEDQDLV